MKAVYHLRNVNYGRDYKADLVADIVAAQDGDCCPNCALQGKQASSLQAVRGVEIGNIFKLGERYSRAMGCFFLDQNGQSQPILMGSYGIGTGNAVSAALRKNIMMRMANLANQHALYQVSSRGIDWKQDPQAMQDQAEMLYEDLRLSR